MADSTLSIVGLEALLTKLGVETPIPSLPECNVLVSPLDIFRAYLADILSKLIDCDVALILAAISLPQGLLGDLEVVVPRLRIKGQSPADLAFDLCKRFPKCPLFLLPVPESIHLRIFLSPKTLPGILVPYIRDRAGNFGHDVAQGIRNSLAEEGERKKVIIEFSSPNLANEFNGAHLRSTILGQHFANLYESRGWSVTRLNYLGDWGRQIGLLAAGWSRFGSEEAFAENPLRHLVDVYSQIETLFKTEQDAAKKAKDEGGDPAEIESQGLFAERDAFFTKMEERDPEAIALWEKFSRATVEGLQKSYERIGVTFDSYDGESSVSPESIVKVESELKERGLYTESEGSLVVDYGRYGTAVLRNRKGTTLYLLRDIAAVLDREQKFGGFDKMLYVVSAKQDQHFHQTFDTLEFIGRSDLKEKVAHVGFGNVSGVPHKALLDDLVGECTKAMSTSIQEASTAEGDDAVPLHFPTDSETVAEAIGWTAIVAHDSVTRRNNNYAFDAKKIAAFNNDSGLALQNGYARLCVVLNRLQGAAEEEQPDNVEGRLPDGAYTDVLRLAVQYPDMTRNAYSQLEPSFIMAWLYRFLEQVEFALDDDDEQGGAGTENGVNGVDGEEGEPSANGVGGGEPAEDQDKQEETRRTKVRFYVAVKHVMEGVMKLLGMKMVDV